MAPLAARYRVIVWLPVPDPTSVPQAEMTWDDVLNVVRAMSIRPAGRDPLSRSSSTSYPTTEVPKVADWVAPRLATVVFRQNRSGANDPGTVMGIPRSFDVRSFM